MRNNVIGELSLDESTFSQIYIGSILERRIEQNVALDLDVRKSFLV